MDPLSAALRRFIDWFDRQALPLWAKAGWDGRRGGFYEALDFDGRPLADLPRRVRVQTRQVRVFAEAAAAGLHPEASRLARQGFDYFLARACPDEGRRGCVHVLSPDGVVLDDRRDLYDQAFLLLACASMWRAFREAPAIRLAERVMRFLDGELASRAGGFAEDDRSTLPRRQNPHMHLFEAFLALHDATGDAGWLARADAVVRLLSERFYDAAEARLVEFFEADWRPADGGAGRVIEPGHMAEWATLLARYGRVAPPPGGVRETDLLALARRHGENAEGFLVDRARRGEVAAGPRRLWPQLEYLRASLALARGESAAEDRDRATALIARLFRTYFDQPVAGLWCDQYDAEGKPAARDVPASILYHLGEAAADARRFLEDAKA